MNYYNKKGEYIVNIRYSFKTPCWTGRDRFRYTLIELMVTVSIIVILVSLLLSVLRMGMEKQKQLVCADNLRTLAPAFVEYSADNQGRLPWGAWYEGSLNGARVHGYGWDDLIHPYARESEPELPFHRARGYWWEQRLCLEVLVCPKSVYDPVRRMPGSRQSTMIETYKIPTASGCIASYRARSAAPPRARHTTEILAPSETIQLTERDDTAPQGSNGWVKNVSVQGSRTWYLHPDGKVNYLMADGRVKAYQIDAEEIIGKNGTKSAPKGMWTLNPND